MSRPRLGRLFSARPRRYAALLLAVLVMISAVALWMAPRWLVPHLAARFPGCLYAVETTAPAVALTIDDGPDPSTTTDLLRELRDHGAHATFFLISGNVASGDSVVAAIVAAGHEIGNHLTRDESSISLAPATFDSALVGAGRILSRFAPVRWARPGGGRYTRRMITIMAQRGYECALGSIYPYDAELPSSRFSSAFVLAHARPGAIIVLHDGGDRGRRTTAALHRLLPELRRRGLRVVSLSELTTLRTPHLGRDYSPLHTASPVVLDETKGREWNGVNTVFGRTTEGLDVLRSIERGDAVLKARVRE